MPVSKLKNLAILILLLANLALLAVLIPNRLARARASGFGSYPTTRTPARCSRRLIPAPMRPSPIMPSSIMRFAFLLHNTAG